MRAARAGAAGPALAGRPGGRGGRRRAGLLRPAARPARSAAPNRADRAAPHRHDGEHVLRAGRPRCPGAAGEGIRGRRAQPPGADTAVGRRAQPGGGLRAALPHEVAYTASGPVGGAVYSAYPLTDRGRPPTEHFAMPRAEVDVAGAPPVEVVAAHPMPPVASSAMEEWRASLRELPDAAPDGVLRILAGDFNATHDHAEFRALLETGYTDAAAATGDGWDPTWPSDGSLPGTVLDHVLVDRRAAVEDTDVHTIPGSDHRAVVTTLTLPAASR
ncbi:endonuclease/exonuclease/phosphatase family protein [Streptomonospora nanhaiensis]|uniref:endonuclease/exonuclease/phosphatase family protein n=1 Tax=Streptomonospora nanhaiensis TaxID=1323731 RepID=UPI003556C61C